MRIAVVGTGIAGLGAAWLLRSRHDITVFEAAPKPGGHTNTFMAGDQPVDTGFIVYNERNYPRLRALFDALGVASQPSDMSFGVSIGSQGGGDALEWAGDDWRKLFAQRRNALRPSHWRMIADILRFNREAKALLTAGDLPDVMLGDFLDARGFGMAMRTRYLLPMGAAIWSIPTRHMLDFPVASLVRFFDNHGLLDLRERPRWRTVTGGSRTYVDRILEDLPGSVHLNTPVQRVARESEGVCLIDTAGAAHRFDQAILAAHADQTLAMLADATASERRLLSVFGFQANRAVLHTDTKLMPRRRTVWSSWNYLADCDGPSGQRVSVSYWMNRLQNIPGETDYIVSLNPLQEPDPARVFAEFDYDHPVFDRATVAAQSGLDAIQGRDRLWFCGAWCGYGFHEDGLAAGERVARGLGAAPLTEPDDG